MLALGIESVIQVLVRNLNGDFMKIEMQEHKVMLNLYLDRHQGMPRRGNLGIFRSIDCRFLS